MRTDKHCTYLENIDVQKWAQEVHQQKIVELKQAIAQKMLKLKAIYKVRRNHQDENFQEKTVQRLKNELISFKKKLKYLESHSETKSYFDEIDD